MKRRWLLIRNLKREQLDVSVSHVLLRHAIKAMDQHLAEVVDAHIHITSARSLMILLSSSCLKRARERLIGGAYDRR
jgi:hypothetical protein